MNNKIDLLVSFDTTGSMYTVLAQVRREVEQFVKTMFNDFSDLRLGVIVHGDYCDKDNPYTIRIMDFTRDENRLCKFVRETEKTYGGDADECYELVLNTAHRCLDWRDDADKIMIMIGDASPHGIYYRDNKDNLDWEKEAGILAKEGIKIFAVHALACYRKPSKYFYTRIAEKTLGVYLTLNMFNEIVDLIKATIYQQGGEEKLNEFVTIIKDSGKMTKSMSNNIKRLRGEEVEDTYETYSYVRPPLFGSTGRRKVTTSDVEAALKSMSKLAPVLPGRFQIMTVDENCDIKGFVESNGIKFKKGRGFYELSKAETVQQYKEVIMMDRETGEMFNGSQVREELGLQPQSEKGGVNERLHKDATKKFRVFVQSTSVNRKLIAGTTFLYEVDDLVDTGTVIEEEVKPAKKAKAKVKVESTEDITKTVEVTEVAKETKTVKKAKAKVKVESTEDITKTVEVTEVAKETKTVKKAKSTKKAKAKVKVEPANKELTKSSVEDKVTIKSIEKVENQIEKVTDGLGRYKTSKNKKNTTFLKNNLTKLIEEAEKLIKEIGE